MRNRRKQKRSFAGLRSISEVATPKKDRGPVAIPAEALESRLLLSFAALAGGSGLSADLSKNAAIRHEQLICDPAGPTPTPVAGGAISVSYNPSDVTLVSVTPAPGYTVDDSKSVVQVSPSGANAVSEPLSKYSSGSVAETGDVDIYFTLANSSQAVQGTGTPSGSLIPSGYTLVQQSGPLGYDNFILDFRVLNGVSSLAAPQYTVFANPNAISGTPDFLEAPGGQTIVAGSATISPATVGGFGLDDGVYHGNGAYTSATLPNPNPNSGLTNAQLGGNNAALATMVGYAAANTPNYTFVNTNDAFIYSGGSGASTASFLGADAAGAALTDPANVNDTIFDAEGYFQTPTANDAGTYTLTLPPTGGAANSVDDIVAVYVGGNGTPGSGTLVGSSGWQGANAGLPGFQITLSAGADTTSPASIPVEIIYGNGFGGAYLSAVSGSNPLTGVEITDPNGVQVTSYQSTATDEPLAGAPTLNDISGNNKVQLSWNSTFLASSYSVYRYLASASPSTATQLATDVTGTSYTDSTAVNGTAYDYYITADNEGGSTPSNTVTGNPEGVLTPGLADGVYHGNNAYTDAGASVPNPNPNSALVDSTFGGNNAAITSLTSYAAAHSPNYTFVNTNDAFVYSGDSGAITANFLGADAAGAALTDPADVNDTLFDAEGYFQTPAANDVGTYTLTLPPTGGAANSVDDLVAVYLGGNGTPGSGTLIGSSGWQSANAGLPGFQFALSAAPNSSLPALIPIEIIYGNGNGGAYLSPVSGSNPNTGVQITDPSGVQATTYETYVGGGPTPATEPAPSPFTATDQVGATSVLLNWGPSILASSYSVYRYLSTAAPSTATQLATGLTATTYTDSTAVNGTTYDYYIAAVGANGTTDSNTLTVVTTPEPTGPVTGLTGTRTNATTITLSWSAPPLGTNYTVTRSTTAGGTQTTLTPAGGQTATTFTDTNAPIAGNTSYYYTVTSVNSGGTSSGVTIFFGAGDGWSADYYTDTISDPSDNGEEKPLDGDASNAALAFERIDPTISVLSNTPPGWNSVQTSNGGMATNDFAVRWVGYVEAPLTGYYSLGVQNADDKEEITVYDANPADLTDGSPTPVNISPAGYTLTGFGGSYMDPVVTTGGVPYEFIAGQQYLVQVDYNQGNGGYNANLYWAASSSTSNQTAGTYDVLSSQVVPTSNVVAPTPQFATVDASGAVTKDSTSDTNYPNPPNNDDYYSFAPTSVGDGTVTLQWNNIGADSYNLYRSTSPTGPFTQINTSPITATGNGAPVTYTDIYKLTDGVTYTYILTGVDESGETAVKLSNGTTSGLTTTAEPIAAAPTTPTGVTAVMIDSSTLGVQGEVNFAAVPSASSYTVERSTSATGPFTTVSGGTFTTTGSTVLFTDSTATLSPSVNYYYQVIANGATLSSAPSTPVETNIAGPALATVGTVEVDVIAAASGSSASVTAIPNFGNQGGIFATGGTDPVTAGAVEDGNSASFDAYTFDGTNYATSSFNSPTDLNGNSSRSIEVWVDNPNIDVNEETMVSWAHRGGNPNGSNESFSYGSQYGVGQWGGTGYDLQWTNTAPGVVGPGAAPSGNTWHYLVFTYDGTNNDVYVDGQLYLQQPVAAGGLATFAGFPVNLAAQNSSTLAGTFTAAIDGGVDLASVRIESGALTAADVMNNYDVGVQGQYSGPQVTSVTPNTGPAAGGTTVTINGTGFTGATAVTFGGVAATGVVVNSAGTQITAVDPAGTGTVDVQVTAPNASDFLATSIASTADQFTYVSAPPPTVVSVTTNDGEGDGNTTQASEVRQLVVNFSEAVNLTQPGAFSLGVYNLTGTGGAVSGNGANDGSITDISSVLNTATSSNGGLTWTITFAPGTAHTDASASLIDGIYSFSINNSDVTSNGVALTGSNAYTFHRLFGDVTGTGAVNNTDARDFSKAYGTAAGSANYNAAFDFGGAGANINNTDARDFSLRYGQSFSSVLPAGGIN